MMKNHILFIMALLSGFCNAQRPEVEMFSRTAKAAAQYVPDTTAVPNDKLTAEIRRLREAKGGFNIQEAVLFKIKEDKEITSAEKEKMQQFFTAGTGARALENAVIHIYRNHFTLQEIKQLTRFYSSPAGQKLSVNLPLIMLESLKAAEIISKNHKGVK